MKVEMGKQYKTRADLGAELFDLAVRLANCLAYWETTGVYPVRPEPLRCVECGDNEATVNGRCEPCDMATNGGEG